MTTLRKLLKTPKAFIQDPESGLSLAETMVAAIVILIILIATATGLSTSFNASVTAENRNKAVQLVNNTLAIAKQAPYGDLTIKAPTADAIALCGPYPATFSGESRVTLPAGATQYDGLNYCETKQFGNAGITFNIKTDITWVSTYDSASLNTTMPGSGYYPKRTTVTVSWSEKANADGTAIVEKVVGSWIKTPTIKDCIPAGLNTGTVNGKNCDLYDYSGTVPTLPPSPTTAVPRSPYMQGKASVATTTNASPDIYLLWKAQAATSTQSTTVAFKVTTCSGSSIISKSEVFAGLPYNGGIKVATAGVYACGDTTNVDIWALDADGDQSAGALTISVANIKALTTQTGAI